MSETDSSEKLQEDYPEKETPVLRKGRLDSNGNEVGDPTPIQIPAGFQEPESMESMMQRLIRTHVSEVASNSGLETFEEADDFDIEDDDHIDPSTPYETFFDPILEREITPADFMDRQDYYREEYQKKVINDGKQIDLEEAIEARRAEQNEFLSSPDDRNSPAPQAEPKAAEPDGS